MNDLCHASIADLAAHIECGDLSPLELTQALLRRIERHNDEMRVYITVTAELALEQARQAEREVRAGAYRGPLHGIPIALKDNIATRGIRTSCASLVDPDWIPDADATVYARLREAGAVLVGKTNLFEYAFSQTPAFPQPLNPWHPGRTPAGSSSGSGVAVAAGMAHGAIGTDTGGSGRAPASVNGVVGLKATYGMVSRWGVVPLSYSLDHTTVLSRTVVDSAIMLQAIAGHDARDEYSTRVTPLNFRAEIGRNVQGLRVAWASGYTLDDIDPDVVSAMRAARNVLEDLGAKIETVRLPFVEHARAMQSAVLLPEAAEIHYGNLRNAADRLGESALMRLDLGNVIPATDYIHAQRQRKRLRDAFRELFERYDLIAGPALPTRAGLAEGWNAIVDGEQIDMRVVGPEYTGIHNLAGTPAIVIPAGFSSEGTPIGMQLAARWFDEPRLLRAAHAYEQATEWHTQRPPLPVDAPAA